MMILSSVERGLFGLFFFLFYFFLDGDQDFYKIVDIPLGFRRC